MGATITGPRHYRALRGALLAGLGLAGLLVGYGLTRYPAVLGLSPDRLVPALLLLLALILYAGIAIGTTRSVSSAAAGVALHEGWVFGLLVGAMWVVEVLTGNLGAPAGNSITLLVYRGATLAVPVLTLAAGVRAAQQTGRLRAGTLAGLWSGLISGLIAGVTLLLVTYLFMDVASRDPQNLAQFARSGERDLATFLVGDTLFAATSHLWIGLLLGAGLGALGGLLGRALPAPHPRV